MVLSHATYVACGLKYVSVHQKRLYRRSCHVCGMWIEITYTKAELHQLVSCHVCGMWIEIEMSVCIGYNTSCHATYVACGLKSSATGGSFRMLGSCHVCGMWIEIFTITMEIMIALSCHVCGMWIEMLIGAFSGTSTFASCHVCGMWIEMTSTLPTRSAPFSHATYVACGLKYERKGEYYLGGRHATYVACGLKFLP